MPKKISTKDFIEKAKLKHGSLYDYSFVDYKGTREKVTIICSKHGSFEQVARAHLQGKGCYKCKGTEKIPHEKFLNKLKKIYKENCSFEKVNYTGRKNNIVITCRVHGDFTKRADEALRGKGCPKCINSTEKSTQEFIEAAKEVHGDRYKYSYVFYKNNKSKVTINCPKHGNFKQRPNHHLNGAGCPGCRVSKGESIIEQFLTNKNIKYYYEYPICLNEETGGYLRADFYLEEKNTVIEFDGIQHFKPVKYWGGVEGLKNVKKRDSLKNKYCKENNIKLIRIKYNDLKKIEDILENNLF